MNRRGSLVTFGVLSLAARGAYADDEVPAPDAPPQAASSRADAEYREGTRAYEEKRFADAAAHFEAAHRLSPHPDAAFNAARAYEQAGDRPRAADLYVTSLRLEGLSERFEGYATSHLDALRRALGLLHVPEPLGAEVTVAHVENAVIPVTVHVEPGRHRLVVEAPGRAPVTRELDVAAGETVRLALTLETTIAPDAPPPTKPPPVAAPAEPGVAPNTVTGLVFLGMAVASAGAGVGLGVAALDANDRWESSGLTDVDARDEAVALRTWANVGYFAAAGHAVAGVLTLFIPFGSSPEAAASIRVDVATPGVTAAGRF